MCLPRRGRTQELSGDDAVTKGLLLVLLALATAAPINPASGQARPTARTPNSSAIETAIVVGSARTQEAVDQANAQLQAMFRKNRVAEQKALQAMAAARAAGREAGQYAAELAEARGALKSVLDQLAAKDIEFSAYLEAFRSGLAPIVENGDPATQEALRRYADGDVGALDDLQQITRVIREARQAGLRARNAADQRALALIYISAWDNGDKTASQVRMAWEEAAQIEPEEIRQWIEIAAFYSVEGKLPQALAAIERGKRVARSDAEKALIFLQESAVYRRFSMSVEARKACENSGSLYLAFTPSTDLEREQKRKAAGSATCMRNFDRIYDRAPGEPFDLKMLEAARIAYEASPSDFELVRRYTAQLTGKLATELDSYDAARADMEMIIKLRREIVALRPKLKNLRYDLARSIDDLAQLDYAFQHDQLATDNFQRFRDMIATLLADDPDNFDYQVDHARALTWLTSIALRNDSAQADTFAKQLLTEATAIDTRASGSLRSSSLLGWAHYNMGRVERQRGQFDEAALSFSHSADLRRRLHAYDSANVEFADELRSTLDQFARTLLEIAKPEQAKATMEELLKLSEQLARDHGGNREFLAKAALANALFSELPVAAISLEDATSYLRKAEEWLARIGPTEKLNALERQLDTLIRLRLQHHATE